TRATVCFMVLRRGKRRKSEIKPKPGTEIVMLQDEHGLLLTGSSEAVTATVEWLTSIEPSAVRARPSGSDAVAMAATGTALTANSEYVRLTDASKTLLQEHGAIPGANGTFRGFVKDVEGHFAGVLDFKPAGVGPEQALALQ